MRPLDGRGGGLGIFSFILIGKGYAGPRVALDPNEFF